MSTTHSSKAAMAVRGALVQQRDEGGHISRVIASGIELHRLDVTSRNGGAAV